MPPRDRVKLWAWQIALVLGAGAVSFPAGADNTPQAVPFTQRWLATSLITANDDWNGVAGILGYRGDDLTTAIGGDPRIILGDGSGTPIDVIANQLDIVVTVVAA